MRTIETIHPIVGRDRDDVLALVARSRTARGFEPLSENKAIGVARSHPTSTGVLLRDDDALEAYAQIESDEEGFSTEVVTTRDSGRAQRDEMTASLLRRVIDEVASRGGGTLRYFLPDPNEEDEALARRFGFEPSRELLVLRRPSSDSDLKLTATSSIRAFRPGTDEAAWVALNSRAFSWHPEQGAWTVTDLEERERQEWFDAAGFLCWWIDGRLAGSCWTKIHTAPDPVGEIYVMSVDPEYQGHGIGRALLAAGVAHLTKSGVPATILYVEGDNDSALGLYRSFGFENERRTVVATASVAAR